MTTSKSCEASPQTDPSMLFDHETQHLSLLSGAPPYRAFSYGGIFVGMRVKTSVTIDEQVLRAIDRAVTRGRSRSRILEEAARDYLARQTRAAREARDREVLDEAADALNSEMEDVLSYQADL